MTTKTKDSTTPKVLAIRALKNSHITREEIIKITVAAMTALSMSNAHANGLALNEQSASSAGTAFAGRASSALDASTVYGNPAGLSKLKRTEVSGGFALIDAKISIHDVNSEASGTSKGDSVPIGAIPFGYFATPIDDRYTFGLGFYVPAGLVNDYESSFQGRYYGSYSKTSVVTIQPTLAIRLTDRISIGGGPTFNRIDGKLQNYLATGAFNNGTETRISISGTDDAVGYNIGALIDLGDSTTWGLTYHSKVTYHLTGKTKITGAPNIFSINGQYDSSLDLTLPEIVDTSLTHHFNDQWTGYIGALWTRWSRLKSLNVISEMPENAVGSQLSSISEEMNWHDTLSVAIGGAYQLDKHWQLRAGFAYDPSPSKNENRNVRIPTGNRKSLTIGAGYSPTDDITLDFAYGYVRESNASVSESDSSGFRPAYNATYQNTAQGFTTQLTYRF